MQMNLDVEFNYPSLSLDRYEHDRRLWIWQYAEKV